MAARRVGPLLASVGRGCLLGAMNYPEKTLPTLRPEAAAAQADRQAREAAALRENLRRRKAQARAREDTPTVPENSPGGPG